MRAIENRCYKLGLRLPLVTFAVLISADIVQKMAIETMVSKLESYRNDVVKYNATDGEFQGGNQKLGRDIYSSHLIGRYRACGHQRCRVYLYASGKDMENIRYYSTIILWASPFALSGIIRSYDGEFRFKIARTLFHPNNISYVCRMIIHPSNESGRSRTIDIYVRCFPDS